MNNIWLKTTFSKLRTWRFSNTAFQVNSYFTKLWTLLENARQGNWYLTKSWWILVMIWLLNKVTIIKQHGKIFYFSELFCRTIIMLYGLGINNEYSIAWNKNYKQFFHQKQPIQQQNLHFHFLSAPVYIHVNFNFMVVQVLRKWLSLTELLFKCCICSFWFFTWKK